AFRTWCAGAHGTDGSLVAVLILAPDIECNDVAAVFASDGADLGAGRNAVAGIDGADIAHRDGAAEHPAIAEIALHELMQKRHLVLPGSHRTLEAVALGGGRIIVGIVPAFPDDTLEVDHLLDRHLACDGRNAVADLDLQSRRPLQLSHLRATSAM